MINTHKPCIYVSEVSGSLIAKVNERETPLFNVPFWINHCIDICSELGGLDISFKASMVTAGIDNVELSSTRCIGKGFYCLTQKTGTYYTD